MCRKGEITVFLAMILFSICALLCVIVESARTAGANPCVFLNRLLK